MTPTPPPTMLFVCLPDAAPHPVAHSQTPPGAYPTAARAPPTIAPCSPNRYRAATYLPYTTASPSNRPRLPAPRAALHPLRAAATRATSAPANSRPPPRCSVGTVAPSAFRFRPAERGFSQNSKHAVVALDSATLPPPSARHLPNA